MNQTAHLNSPQVAHEKTAEAAQNAGLGNRVPESKSSSLNMEHFGFLYQSEGVVTGPAHKKFPLPQIP
jgi:hypothetical protein